MANVHFKHVSHTLWRQTYKCRQAINCQRNSVTAGSSNTTKKNRKPTWHARWQQQWPTNRTSRIILPQSRKAYPPPPSPAWNSQRPTIISRFYDRLWTIIRHLESKEDFSFPTSPLRIETVRWRKMTPHYVQWGMYKKRRSPGRNPANRRLIVP